MKNYQKVNVPAGEARRVARFIESDWCRSIYQQFAGWCRSTFLCIRTSKMKKFMPSSPDAAPSVVDGETVELQAGDWLRVAPAGERQLSATADSAISDLYSGESRLSGRLYDDGRCGEVRGSHTSKIKVIGMVCGAGYSYCHMMCSDLLTAICFKSK